MARQLQTIVAVLDLDPETYQLRDGDTVGDVPRSPSRDDLDWTILAPMNQLGNDDLGSRFLGTDNDRWNSRVTLANTGGDYTTDVDFGSPRTARTPTLAAAGVRAWLAIELAYLEPETLAEEPTGATVRWRLWDGSGALWWSGTDWEAPATDDDWNTEAEVVAHFPELPGSVRELAVIARLGTTDASYTPSFYGATVAYGVRQISAWDDAVIRTLVAEIRTLEIVGVVQPKIATETDTIQIPGEEWAYEVTGVDAVFDLTADPEELAELPGSWSAGTWTGDDPIPAGHVARVEFRYRPDVVARRHQDVEELARLPAVYLAALGAPRTVERAADVAMVRDLTTDPPTALVIPGPELVALELQIRVLAELGSDTERIVQALRAWIGPAGYRVLVSPETGEVMTVREAAGGVELADLLGQGIVEARGTWILTYRQHTAQTGATETLVREEGVQIEAVDPTL